MTPEEIARGVASTVAHLFNCLQLSRQDKDNYEAVVQEIAAALQEYGETEYRRGLGERHCEDRIAKAEAEAEAEGYERGKKEIRDACSQHQHEQYADGYRRGVEIGQQCCVSCKETYHIKDCPCHQHNQEGGK